MEYQHTVSWLIDQHLMALSTQTSSYFYLQYLQINKIYKLTLFLINVLCLTVRIYQSYKLIFLMKSKIF